ncbi:phenoloxidase 2-like [Venturia canescens]|uniref:phenoloxidase 2-like n=1 Tax=Venturia canescens TaxID=32260 RepID=UPI001C9CC531|nr:phenoloxidase 2-like [Venturia canescens]
MENNVMKILSLLERPFEPVFIPKGPVNISFKLIPESLPERFQPFINEIHNSYCEDPKNSVVRVKNISLPDLSIPMRLDRNESFTLFSEHHREMAADLINTFMGMRTFDDFLAVAASSRDHLNPQLFFYALSVAILHRKDTRNIPIPPLHGVFPERFFERSIFPKIQEQSNIMPAGSRIPVEIKKLTATPLEPEHQLAYFREDIGINLHHYHWHLVYPIVKVAKEIVEKDRRGELFYYAHQQILARYNAERLCAQLGRIKKIKSFEEPEAEAYFPKLTTLNAEFNWASRPAGLTVFQDVSRPVEGFSVKRDDLKRWKERIYLAIHLGEVTTETGEIIKLTADRGIDILGNMVEASPLTPNRQLYGDLHNSGHMCIATCHDPDGRYMEPEGVMGSVVTAMRDPMFYRWHNWMNEIFVEYKSTLPEYTNSELDFPGIEITSSRVTSPDVAENTLLTFWTKSDVNITHGLDFAPRGDVFARMCHLNHANFRYHITVLNNSSSARTGTVRIFMGPKYDERQLQFPLREQMRFMIEMDKFVVTLQPGDNFIERLSNESSVTLSFEKIFRNHDLWETLQKTDSSGSARRTDSEFCGCGWPHYMLLPKGTAGGYAMELFVMVSNHADDFVQQSSTTGCSDASAYCGLRDRKYPDARAMGFPFDRKPHDGIETLSDFARPNMSVTNVKVKFTDTVVPRSFATA